MRCMFEPAGVQANPRYGLDFFGINFVDPRIVPKSTCKNQSASHPVFCVLLHFRKRCFRRSVKHKKSRLSGIFACICGQGGTV